MAITAERKDLKEKICSLTESNTSLSEDCTSRSSTIEKLQVRCASLVAEKTEKMRLLEQEKAERLQEKNEITAEYERAMKVNNDLKDIITKDREQNKELSEKLKDSKTSGNTMTKELSELKEINVDLGKKVEILEKHLKEKSRRLEHDNNKANKHIESLTKLISEQNAQLASLKKQTEEAIQLREEANKENLRKIAEMETVIKYHTQQQYPSSSSSSTSSSSSLMGKIALQEAPLTTSVSLSEYRSQRKSNSYTSANNEYGVDKLEGESMHRSRSSGATSVKQRSMRRPMNDVTFNDRYS